ncbi:hypothetical protein PQX77_005536 [Marasmius sp. AFHP31]|nr:hypothetical protein PQX77_005536 [Marasmius sp. AFHP31]
MPTANAESPPIEGYPIGLHEHETSAFSKNLASRALDARRVAALEDVDSAAFSWFHFKVCAVVGVGFFTDAYDIFAISIASIMLGFVYGNHTDPDRPIGALKDLQDVGIKVATPAGTFIGQIFFGWLADRVGRKRMYGVELIIMIVATFAQALSGSIPSVHIITVLIVWRIFLGIGIGGDYPASAVITSEFASTNIRGRMMNAVFAFQGLGNLFAALVGLGLVSAYKHSIMKIDVSTDNWDAVDPCWRLLIGLGCVPGVIALCFRFTITETPRFTMDIERNIQQAARDIEMMHTTAYSRDLDATHALRAEAPRASWRDFLTYFSQWENFKVLFGCAWSWLALDFAYYGLGFNASFILRAISSKKTNFTSGSDVYDSLHKLCVQHLILSAAGLIPGYCVCLLFIDRCGRKPIQLMGFIVLTILFIIMASAFNTLKEKEGSGLFSYASTAFVALFVLANFFQNFGPNTTTFIVPGEVFPTRYRSTGHGIAAGSGKLGAIIAQFAFGSRVDTGGNNDFVRNAFIANTVFMFSGVFSTMLIPETKGKSLEELSNEDQEEFYGALNHRAGRQRGSEISNGAARG